jgi:hypothetical protein
MCTVSVLFGGINSDYAAVVGNTTTTRVNEARARRSTRRGPMIQVAVKVAAIQIKKHKFLSHDK